MDARCDELASWIATNSVYYTLVAVNAVSRFWVYITGAAQKSWNAIVDAHREDLWLFTERNGAPWVIKNSVRKERATLNTLQLVGEQTYFVYRPEKMLFQRLRFHPEHNEWSVQEEVGTNGFTDVVLARVIRTDTGQNWDMSSFFHNIRWVSNASDAPSLLEVATVCLLNIQIVVGVKDLVEKFVLEVLTADGEERTLVLDPQPFAGWPVVPDEDEVVEEEEEASESEEENNDQADSTEEEGEIRE